ncbi:MAG: hypothetical protein H0V82_09570 [Candidatus Protochlamydia sp.]|nr:hypothetical protein [Candidatus Protochlamydia sp.]
MKKIFFLFSMFFALNAAMPLVAELDYDIASSVARRRCCSKIRFRDRNNCPTTCPTGPTGATGPAGATGPGSSAEIACFGSFYTQFDTSSPEEFGQVLPGSCVPLNLTQANVGNFVPVTLSNGEPPRGETVRAWEVETGCEGIYHVVWGVNSRNTGTEIALTINGVPVQGGEVDTGAGNQTTTYASIVTLNAGDQICIQNVGEIGSSTLELGTANGPARGDNNTAFLVLFRLHDPILTR